MVEALFPLVENPDFDPPRIARVDREIRVGDDARVVSKGRPVWATVIEIFPDSKYALLVSSFAPCDAPLRRGMRAIANDDDLWITHAPGSHKRFLEHALRENVKTREGSEGTGACESCLTPCYLHERAPDETFEDARGCWRCGGSVESRFGCEACRVALYCSAKCRVDDTFAHLDMCRIWAKKD